MGIAPKTLLLLMLTACTEMPAQPGPVANVVGAPGSSIVWEDSTGARVDGIVGLDSPTFFEADGTVWKVDIGSGVLQAASLSTDRTIMYAASDCTGPGLVAGVTPRVTFYMNSEIRTVNDTGVATQTTVCSSGAPGHCQLYAMDTSGNPICEQHLAVPIEQTSTHAMPAIALAGPIHPILVGP